MKSVFGLDEKVAAALAYLAGFISGIVVLVLERENKFVRFHALQSTIWFLFLAVVRWGLNFIMELFSGIPLISTLLALVISPVLFILLLVWIGTMLYMMYKAYNGAMFKLPIVGEVVWSQINK